MKKILILVLFGLIISFTGCNKNKSTPGSSRIINISKFAEILADIHIADAQVSFLNKPVDSGRQYIADYYHVIFLKYHITKEEFTYSMDYYMHNPDKMDKVYESVNEILSTKKGKKW
jgi:hypothetical protein